METKKKVISGSGKQFFLILLNETDPTCYGYGTLKITTNIIIKENN